MRSVGVEQTGRGEERQGLSKWEVRAVDQGKPDEDEEDKGSQRTRRQGLRRWL